MLINLSNHPFSGWDNRQLQAAAGFGEIIDLSFPDVDPSGDEEYIERLAEKYIEKITQLSHGQRITVHLMGEMTLTIAILRRLLDMQIKCIASTSHRIVVDDGPGKKKVTFKFERFRNYRY